MGNPFNELCIASYTDCTSFDWIARIVVQLQKVVHPIVVIHSRHLREIALVITRTSIIVFNEEEERIFYSTEVAGIST